MRRDWFAYFQGQKEWEIDHDPEYSNGIRKLLFTQYPKIHFSTSVKARRRSTCKTCAGQFFVSAHVGLLCGARAPMKALSRAAFLSLLQTICTCHFFSKVAEWIGVTFQLWCLKVECGQAVLQARS